MSGLKKKFSIKSFEEAEKIIGLLIERVEMLEKITRGIYHKQSQTGRAIGASMHDVNSGLTNVKRQITQLPKK